jgi:hypothetical protein
MEEIGEKLTKALESHPIITDVSRAALIAWWEKRKAYEERKHREAALM